ncbi:hypothetical protein B0T22DRAFT_471515 [Podospora appendiculata]|uniref:FAD-binding FR-type domain-containing protein n=1 Tax=Podospora appendiculata TaxID=314037 RepID=A0AAE1C8B7_9PEZI|nr:hypothetical protein B0T22DRAFT_471515 [Podospora appendiculata]
MMSGLSIDLSTRDRVKIAGRMLVGALAERGEGVGEVQIAMRVEESLGNCPKYLNKKDVKVHVPSPRTVGGGVSGEGGEGGGVLLGREAVGVVEKADMFFLSSTDGNTMDTNHRGGPKGFVRVVRNEDGAVVLAYPEYSGNRLYQTLGNLRLNPRVGLVIPDFETADVLYLTGETELLVGEAAIALMPHAKLVVRVVVREARFVRDGLPFVGEAGEMSPYNPPVRKLAWEEGVVVPGQGEGQGGKATALATATLVRRQILSPSIARLTFQLHPEKGRQPVLGMWKPGQHVTLDFSDELDHGWSHMRDDDPQSLNDDFVRTFTVSNPPPSQSKGQEGGVVGGTEMELTVRRHGPATGFLWRHNTRVPLHLPVLGFGGAESFRIAAAGGDPTTKAIFVAGGVGITPLLAQAQGVLAGGQDLALLWSLRAEDLPLAVDTFEKIPGLAKVTRLFVTGKDADEDALRSMLEKSEAEAVVLRRISREDVLGGSTGSDNGGTQTQTKYYLCAGPELHRVLESWLQGEEVVSESFNY